MVSIALLAVVIAACGSDPVRHDADGGVGGGGGGLDGAISVAAGDAASRRDSASQRSLVITPGGSVAIDSLTPQPINFTARLNDGSPSSVAVTWSVKPRELGSIDASTGVFTASGAGGKLTVSAQAGTLASAIIVDVVVRVTQQGDPDFGNMPDGAGGIGGVGGEGGGSAITDTSLRNALDAEPTVDPSFSWLYPYDGTVWPRGLPAPLLQWRGDHVPLAVKLTISVDDGYQSTLYLGPPKGVTRVDHLPIPQAVWRAALLSGKTMKVALSYAASDGAGGYKTYKPQREQTWTIAPTALKGTVYYNSYGTKLAENFGGAKGGNGRFGGATLAIEGGSFDPKLAAGSTTPDSSGCRVCHSVSRDGSTLIAMRNDGFQASVYDLKAASERLAPSSDDGKFGWAALYPDGSAALGASGPPGIGQGNIASLTTSAMYRVSDGSVLATTGLSAVVTQAATPSFAPDGSKVAFNLYQGPGAASVPGDGKSLFVMDVKRPDANSFEFSNAKPIFTATGANQLPGWPFFLPDKSGVVFELELAAGGYGEHLMTRLGARGELWWTDLEGHAHALDAANGKGYLPTGGNAHDADTTLQYEPTVAPIVAGGYAWVVFTSRRMYGNVATRNPFESDSRAVDLTPGNSGGPTTKKLWVAAIDVPPKPNTDPSHPAFYLPAQELYAGNSRGFWTFDVCKADGAQCEGGDECCGGTCTIATEFGVCGTRVPGSCAKEYDKCNLTADCCADGASLTCIAGLCATTIFL